MKQEQTSRYPNVIIAGAPKCGTSSLFFWLAAHPEVCASKVKETYFLGDTVNRHNEGLSFHKDGLEAYQSYFSHCTQEKVRLEATPIYIYHQLPLKILPALPEVPKVIFILRSPAEQVYSHYKFNRYRMRNIDMPFSDYVNFEEHGPEGWYNYMERAEYANYLKKWVDVLGTENIKVVQFESLVNDKVATMRRISEYLDVEPEFYDTFGFLKRNESLAVGSRWVHRTGLKLQRFIPHQLQERLLPFYQKINLGKIPSKTDEERQIIDELKESYKPSVDQLSKMFKDFDASLWK